MFIKVYAKNKDFTLSQTLINHNCIVCVRPDEFGRAEIHLTSGDVLYSKSYDEIMGFLADVNAALIDGIEPRATAPK